MAPAICNLVSQWDPPKKQSSPKNKFISTPTKTKMDTQNNVFEQVAPLKKWQFFGIYALFLECKSIFNLKYGHPARFGASI